MIANNSIKARLERVEHQLTLIGASVTAIRSDVHFRHIQTDDIANALQAAAETALEDVYWLTLLPDAVLETPALTDDERFAAEAARREGGRTR